MSDVWGNHLKLSLFGESHGKAIGVVLDGLPNGLCLDMQAVEAEMERRAPGRNSTSTARKEGDAMEIVSGFFEGKTTGTALCGLIYNSDTRSHDYSDIKRYLRPGHADYTGSVRYRGFQDYRGGGHFSGRLTAPLVFAGAVCKQILGEQGIQVFGRVKRIASIEDKAISFTHLPAVQDFMEAASNEIPALDSEIRAEMKGAILSAKAEGDSVGGILEVFAVGLPAGLGDPFFDSVESKIAQLAFSVPAVKGIEFGTGFALADLKGSEANDPFCIEDGEIRTRTNHNGGILGGITSGMPLVFRTAIKPTPSIGMEQETVDLEKREEARFTVKGRHDPCIVPRALPVMEAVAAIALADYILPILD